jgi:FkbM family methyltransferase
MTFNGTQLEILPDCNIAIIRGDAGACSYVWQTKRLDYDRGILDQLIPFLDKQALSVDIGAFIGSHTVEYLKHSAGVVSFEPNPSAFQCLSYNCPKAVKINVALGCAARERYWTRIYPNCGASYLADEPSPDCLTVQVRTLDSYGLDNVGFMKVDAEGEEFAILLGGRETIQRCRPALCMEINEAALERTLTSAREVLSYLRELKYNVLTIPGTEFGLQRDILALPNDWR